MKSLFAYLKGVQQCLSAVNLYSLLSLICRNPPRGAGEGLSDSTPSSPKDSEAAIDSDYLNSEGDEWGEEELEDEANNEVTVSVEGGLPVTSATKDLVSDLEEDADRLLQAVRAEDILTAGPLTPLLSPPSTLLRVI